MTGPLRARTEEEQMTMQVSTAEEQAMVSRPIPRASECLCSLCGGTGWQSAGTEVLFELVDELYRRKHGLIVTANYSLQDLVARERMHPAIVRRLDDMCRVIQI